MLFELLLPKQLKVQAPDQDDIILSWDEATARCPWERLAHTGGRSAGRLPRRRASPTENDGVRGLHPSHVKRTRLSSQIRSVRLSG